MYNRRYLYFPSKQRYFDKDRLLNEFTEKNKNKYINKTIQDICLRVNTLTVEEIVQREAQYQY